MGLLLSAVRSIGKHVAWLAIACVIYIGFQAACAFWGDIPNPLKTIEHLKEDIQSKKKELESLRQKVSSRSDIIRGIDRRIQVLERSKPAWVTLWPPGTHVKERGIHDLELASLKTAKVEAIQARDSALRLTATVEQHIGNLEQAISKTLATPVCRVVTIAHNHWIAGIFFGMCFLFAPMLTRVGWFYVVAPLAGSAAPVRLAQSSQRVGLISEPMLRCSAATKKLDLAIAPNESLFVRAACLKSYDAKTKKRMQIAWKIDSPFISYSAGLWELTRVDGGADGAGVSLWSGEDADRQLVCLELRDHPGLIFRPRHLVGLIHEPEGLRLRKQWRLGHLHAWCTLQLRYIVLEGTGRAVFWALGGIEALSPGGGKQCVAQDSVAGFDSRLDYSVRRNETFWHYLRGKEPLFDDCFEGCEQYLVSVASEHNKGTVGVDTWLERVLSLVGKIFGF
jgi:hypothetical protein